MTSERTNSSSSVVSGSRFGFAGAATASPRIDRRHADFLACFDSVSGSDPLAVQPKLTGARPARDHVEADLRLVALEPAIEANAVVVLADGKETRFGHCRPLSDCAAGI
jgi:hypothetical protein